MILWVWVCCNYQVWSLQPPSAPEIGGDTPNKWIHEHKNMENHSLQKREQTGRENAWQSLTGKSIDAIYELYYNSDLSLSLTRSRDYLNLVTATIGKSVASPSLESSCYPKGHLHIWVCKLNYCVTASFNHLLKNLKIQISGGCPVSSVG